MKKLWLFMLWHLLAVNAGYSFAGQRGFEGFNWYTEKPEIKKKKPMTESEKTDSTSAKELPDYEHHIRDLQERHRQAHRRALDNPTPANLLAELRLEKEMMRKSEIYGERRVAIAMLDSSFSNMKAHSNVLHRKVQEQVDSLDAFKKLRKLSKGWGLVMQVEDSCPHCHAFAPIITEFAENHGFELLAASATGQDFEGMEGVKDEGEMVMFNPARETPMLYLVKLDGREVWPISRGINSEEQIIANIMMIDRHIRRLFE